MTEISEDGQWWWDLHIGLKGWADLQDLRTALVVACTYHKKPVPDSFWERVTDEVMV